MKVRRLTVLVVVVFASFAIANSTIELPTMIAPTFTFRLTVKGMPVGVDIYLSPADPMASVHMTKVKHLHSDKRGILQIKDLPEGDYYLTSNPEPPYAWYEYIRVEAGSQRKRIDVDVPSLRSPPPLLPIYRVRGRILDPSGAAIHDASVVIEQFDLHNTPVAASMTGTDGAFDLKVSPGAYNMKIAAPGFRLIFVPIQVVTDERRPHTLRVLLNVSSGLSDDPYVFDVTPEQ